MSTTGISTWAVDLANVGAIYPFQGAEWLFTIIGVATWIGWHIWCIRWEKQYHQDRIKEYGSAEKMKEAIDAD